MSLSAWTGAPRHAGGPGPGLLWGLAIGFLVWLGRSCMGMLGAFHAASLQAAFPSLVGHALLLGVPLGLALGILAMVAGSADRAPFDLPRALATGAAAGVLGGWLFGTWMEKEAFFPLIAGLLNCDVHLLGVSLHYAIAIVVGISFAFLFQRDLYGTGSSMAWGAVYGLVWWLAGPLTLVRLAAGEPVAWSAAAARPYFASMIAHVFYGLIVGIVYSLSDALWKLLFIGSDPLHRERDSAALRALRSLAWGATAGALLAVPFWLACRSAAPEVAVGHAAGLLMASIALGGAYGILFRRETRDLGAAVCWGLVHGTIGWLVVPATIFPMLAGDGCRWSAESAAGLLGLVPVHLIHGALVGFVYGLVDARHRDAASLDPRVVAADRRRRRPAGTPAPAVWLLVLGMLLLIVALLAAP